MTESGAAYIAVFNTTAMIPTKKALLSIGTTVNVSAIMTP